ncbi:glycosyltransferase family 2 protein [Ornithobacterium rhinotracheale]|uniref:glycosyltransferase family 2 protein n=1 Tax=Ornithobacterium rhinotracheale TaxID=28251 RepID=UPI00129CE18F|nr:glycosyltransferase family 2 protein [Ornithobacterium rhinotracheale]MRJ07401.1 glycosyltransferase family 2 protein [Ornithobacterium rhinotracheale]UOH77998.1 glycosyltransferase family 2 protein [Ornithobacterium rhinotracheale]
MDKPIGLSVAIITYNEEKNIGRTIDAIHNIADEIIVVDSFSSDKTKEICLSFEKIKWFERKFDGFGHQKNYALSLCSGKWILFIDADEVVSKELRKSILEIVNNSLLDRKVFNIQLENYIFGKHVKYGGWGSIWRERFFAKDSVKYSDDLVHEKIVTNEKKYILEGTIKHHTYHSIFHHIEKMNLYTEDMSIKMLANGKKSSIFKIIIKPPFSFFKAYVLQKGFLDGFMGLYLAATHALYTFLKYSKLYILQNK